MYQPTTELREYFEKLCNIKKEKDIKDAITKEAAVSGKYYQQRVYLDNYLRGNMNGVSGELKAAIEKDLEYYKECLAAFQKMARQVAEQKLLELTALEVQRLKELLDFKTPTPKIEYRIDKPVPEDSPTHLVEVQYPDFTPKEVPFPLLSACTLLLCQIETKSVPYHLNACNFVVPLPDRKKPCGKILLRQRKPKDGYQRLCRSHQTYKSRHKKK